NIKSWINTSLKPRRKAQDDAHQPDRPSEQEVTVLVTRLQISSEEVSRKVGQVTDSVIKSLPRMLYDLKLITDDAQAAKRGIDQVRTHLATAHSDDTEAALKKLQQLHIVKTHMEKCRTALKEAENWSNLEAEATRVLDSQDYEGAATRLQNAQHSLDVFQHTPEFEQRRELLRKLQTNLENTLRSKVVEALKAHDAVECYKYYKIYGKIGKADDFVDLYFETRNPKIVETWNQESETNPTWVQSLDQFYKAVFESLSEEYVWCASIFPDPKPVVQAQVQHIFQSLDPSLADRLASIATHQGANALPVLVSTFAVTESFGLSLERLFTKPPVNTASADNATELESLKTRTRRRSNSSQLTLIPLTLRHADANTWSYVLYVPFLPFQSQYASLEGRYLSEQLALLFKNLVKPRSAIDLVQHILNDAIDRIFSLAKESLERCLKMTHGFGAVEWLRMINTYVGEVKREIQKTIHTVKMMDESKKKGASTQSGEQAPRSSSDLDDLDFDDDKEGDDWRAFQLELRLLRLCQGLDMQLTAFKDTITHELENQQQQQQLSNYPRSSMALLRTSRLNSHELQRVVSQVSTISEESQDSIINVMLKDANQHIDELTIECQELVHQAALAPIVRNLDGITSMKSVWQAPDPQPRKAVIEDATIDVDMPQFSLSPNEYITRVGEQLLMLPQEFEVYTDDAALSYHVETIP
ncbi:oligomeric Golgi complex subunit 7, partial [Fennellomyces sp. T-0311]